MGWLEIWVLGALAFALVLITIDLAQGNDFDYSIFWMLPLFAAAWPVMAPITAIIFLHDAIERYRFDV
jgi:hypothetical protein